MIKREFIENNLLKVLNYLPAHIIINSAEYLMRIERTYNGNYKIYYHNLEGYALYYPKVSNDLIDSIIEAINELDKYIPDFANNLINI